MSILGFFNKENKESLNKGLEKTRENFFSRLSRAVAGKSKVDAEVLDKLEEILVSADVGVDTTIRIIEKIEKRVSRDKYLNTNELNTILKEEIISLLEENKLPPLLSAENGHPSGPHVIMIVGVNGAGKTTTIAKLAARYRNEGKKVLLGAADTFRAAAIEQLEIWAERTGSSIVKQNMGSDPASVAFDTVRSGVSGNFDVIIIDTAGRLHNKANLMNELAKVKRVMDKVLPGAPHEVLLVLDGSVGQNAFEQARQFTAVTDVTGLVITKLDGTAKGGVVIGISDQFRVPVRYIGIGEKMEDLQVFDRYEFVNTLFSSSV